MVVKMTPDDEWLIAGTVSRDAEVKFVGEKQNLLCEFSVFCGKKPNGDKIYVHCKAWKDLGGVLSELCQGDAFAGIGRLKTREYNGKTYSDLDLDWGNSPMISAGGEDSPAENAQGVDDSGTEFSALADAEDGELPW